MNPWYTAVTSGHVGVTSEGQVQDTRPRDYWARVVSRVDTHRYLVRRLNDGSPEDFADLDTLDAEAWEIQQREDVPEDSIVRVIRAHWGPYWVFVFEGEGTGGTRADLNEHQIGFGDSMNLLTGHDSLTYTLISNLLRLQGDQVKFYLDNLDSLLHSEIRLRRGFDDGLGNPSDVGSYAILGELLFDARIGGSWVNKGFLRGERSTADYHRVLLSALSSGLDAFLELGEDTGVSPATWAKLRADIVQLGRSGGSLALEPVTSPGVLVGTLLGSNAVQGVTVSTGLNYDAATGVLTCTVTGGGAGTVTSVDVSGGTTGLTASGGPVTGSGTITLAGTLSIANGGTGQTTAPAALDALLPTQSGNSGKVLTTNGTTHSWGASSLDINGLTSAVPDLEDDTLPFYDSSATANRKAVLAYHLGHGDVIGGRLTGSNSSNDPEGQELTYATTFNLKYTPYKSNKILLDDGTGLRVCEFSETTIPRVGGLSVADVFAYWTGSTVAFECLDWASSTARATALAFHSTAGFRIKSGDNTRRYLGTIYSLGSNPSAVVYDWREQRYVWNAYNQILKPLYKYLSIASPFYYTFSGTSWRAANGSSSNKVDVVCGIETNSIGLTGMLNTYSPDASTFYHVGIGEDSTTASIAGLSGWHCTQVGFTGTGIPITARVDKRTAIGLHSYYLLEKVGFAAANWLVFSGAYDEKSGLSGAWLC